MHKMNNFQSKYKVVNFKWGYLIASFDTLREAKQYIESKGMRCDHKKGEFNLYAAIWRAVNC